MDDVVDSKEGARLLLAYEQVEALFNSQGNNGVQREHLLIGSSFALYRERRNTPTKRVKNSPELLEFYNNAEAAIEKIFGGFPRIARTTSGRETTDKAGEGLNRIYQLLQK